MSGAASYTVVIGRYRLDPVAEFEGPRMPPTAMFTKSDSQYLTRLLERTPVGSYDKAANQLFTSVHTWLVRDDAGMVLLIDTCFGNLKNRLPTHPFFHMQKNDEERLAIKARGFRCSARRCDACHQHASSSRSLGLEPRRGEVEEDMQLEWHEPPGGVALNPPPIFTAD